MSLIFSEQSDKIVPELFAVREYFGPLFKNGENPHLKSKYVLLDDILDMLEKALGEKQMYIISAPDTDTFWNNSGSIFNALVTVFIRVIHVPSQQWVEISGQVPFDSSGGTKSVQSYGSALTYLRRYLLTLLFNLSTETDTDGHTGTQGPSTRSNGQAQKITVSQFIDQWKALFDDEDKARDELAKLGDWNVIKKDSNLMQQALDNRKAKA